MSSVSIDNLSMISANLSILSSADGCREAGLPEPEFSLSDSFITTLRRTMIAEPQPESLEMRVLTALASGPLSKKELSARLGHKDISGQLNKIIRLLLAAQNIEQTIPDKPASRLQKYRLTDKGAGYVASLQGQPPP
jgi:ATP-dependent DNA helicase RecG